MGGEAKVQNTEQRGKPESFHPGTRAPAQKQQRREAGVHDREEHKQRAPGPRDPVPSMQCGLPTGWESLQGLASLFLQFQQGYTWVFFSCKVFQKAISTNIAFSISSISLPTLNARKFFLGSDKSQEAIPVSCSGLCVWSLSSDSLSLPV